MEGFLEWYEAEVRALEKAHASDPPPGSVVFYGSSSIRLWTGLTDDFRDLGRDAALVNRGFGGSTLEACVYFFERLVVPCRPRSLVVYAGDNDLGDGQPSERVVGSFRALSRKITRHLGAIPFAFLSIKPSPARWHLIDPIRRTNETIRGDLVARAWGYYVDVFDPMLGTDGRPLRELFAPDGLHLSPAGYRLWTQILHAHGHGIF
jgi:lysophospholipase L1-like esterase